MVLKSGGIPYSRLNCVNTFEANYKKNRQINKFIRGFLQELHAIVAQEKLCLWVFRVS